jgi:uncharacterized protein YndB with AHSA1/START domain
MSEVVMPENATVPTEVTLTRQFAAPRELVFAAWTDQEQLARWWGPTPFTNPVCELDPRPGGHIWIVMRAPDGTEFPMSGVVEEIVPPERLVFSAQALEAEGGEALIEQLTTVTFEAVDGGTKLTVNSRVTRAKPEAAPHLAGMEQGWNMSLDSLGELLATHQA